ncbi:DUF4230 domain-containing protein [Rhodonellum sp.]|uniref:DUF4230 domain-containing protein n=1 Tax=Rhodonellum sp. TaxID=2231180 RepID=UPI002727CBED|nr:DUF4230 domain-containing protein [Rhodonellum sp.]MDO9553397.1 DUF4230 domain-containing protein [Rhodonellum sp.]
MGTGIVKDPQKTMVRFVFGFMIALGLSLTVFLWMNNKESKDEIKSSSAMIQQRIENVGKLIVTEGYFSEVFTFKNSKRFYLDMFSSEKKALVVANAKATVEYDLRQMTFELDEANKTLTVTNIPEPVINIYPDIEYYDVKQEYLNKFEAKDYNKVKESVMIRFRAMIDKSSLKDNANERLQSELFDLFFFTKSMGWTLIIQNKVIEDRDQLNELNR